MPILGDHLTEIDKTYTPLEKRRREEMRLYNTRYGFFRVANGPVEDRLCMRCGRKIVGASLNLCGFITHYEQCQKEI